MQEIVMDQKHRLDPKEGGIFDKDVKKSKSSVAGRIAEFRQSLGISQKGMATHVGLSLPSLKDYEGGKTMPGGEAIQRLVEAGINANWLLTGEGPMLLKEMERPGPAIDVRTLARAIRDVEGVLIASRRTLGPEDKARLIGVLYEHYQSSTQDSDAVERFLQLLY
jgi:transcriptional regulator with XRE-family HTH domain